MSVMTPPPPSRCVVLVRTTLVGSRPGSPVGHQVRDDQRCREEDQAEDEVADEAVPFPRSDTRRPERDRYPDRDGEDRPEPPTVRCENHLTTSDRSWLDSPAARSRREGT